MARKLSTRQRAHHPKLRKGGVVYLPYDRDERALHELARVVAVQPNHVVTLKLLPEFREDERDKGDLRETGAASCVPLRRTPDLEAFASLVALVGEMLTVAAEGGPWTAEHTDRWQRAWQRVSSTIVRRTLGRVKAVKEEHRLKVGTRVRRVGTRRFGTIIATTPPYWVHLRVRWDNGKETRISRERLRAAE